MKKITFLAIMLTAALSFGQAMTNADFATEDLDLEDNGTTGWYGNIRASITGGQARLTYNATGGANMRQDVTFTNAGTYKVTYDVSTSVGSAALTKHTYTSLRPSAGGTVQNELWIPNSNLPSGETTLGNGAGDLKKNFQSKNTSISTAETKTHSAVFLVENDGDILSLYISVNKATSTAGEYLIIDNISIVSTQVTWTGDTDSDWATATNWDTGVVPTAIDGVTIQDLTNDPIISATTGAVAYNITTNNVLTIASGGSLIVGNTSTGNVTYNRNLSFTSGDLEGWHLVGSPVVGQTYNDTYVTANSIASGTGSNRGIATYDNSVGSSNWTYLQSAGSGTFGTATGYSVKTSVTADVSFTGTMNTDAVTKGITIGAGTPFNLISNPFISYINSGTFLTTNTLKLTEETIWVWNPTTKNYDTKVSGVSFIVAPGQGFFVSCGTAGDVTFNEAIQSHQGTDTFLKSESKPEITLNMTDGDLNRYAKIYYNDAATKDFDNGLDGETYSGVANTFDVFTQLVGNNVGKNYQIQSLPNSDLESMIVPVGLKAAATKEITFSAEAMNLPSGLKVFLEDRVNNTFTRIDEASSEYKVTLTAALDGIGRFYLHTTTSALSIDNVALNGVSIFKSNESTLRIVGLQQGNASVKLFNILGKQMMSSSFKTNGVKDISLPKLATGVYIIQLITESGKLNKKIILE